MNTTIRLPTPRLENTFCYYPFTQLALKSWRKDKGATDAFACCHMGAITDGSPLGLAGKVSDLSANEIFNTDAFKTLRESSLGNVKHRACRVCWQKEEETGNSPRLNSASMSEHQVEHFDTLSKTNLSLHDKTFLKNLRILKSAGGEPFLSKGWIDLISQLSKEGYSKEIIIQVTTNGTIINSEILDVLTKFKRVDYTLSIDGTEKIYDYVRYPMLWRKFKDNIDIFTKQFNSTTHVSCCVSVYNAFNLLDLYDFSKSKGVSVGFDTVHPRGGRLDVNILPRSLREKLITYLSRSEETTLAFRNILNYLESNLKYEFAEHIQRITKYEIQALDSVRNQSYKDYLDKPIIDWLNNL